AAHLRASSREPLAQFGHLFLQPALRGDQFGAALADGERVAYEKCPARLRPHRPHHTDSLSCRDVVRLQRAVMAVVTPYVAVNIFEGAKAMGKSLIDMGVAFKAQQTFLIRKGYLPQLMPYVFSAFPYAFGITLRTRS